MPAPIPPELSSCGYAIQQYLYLPTTPVELIFPLGIDDIQVVPESAGTSISIKYARFTRELNAIFNTFKITLYSVTAGTYNQIVNFATQDYLNNVQVSGYGSVELYIAGNKKSNCYIDSPITPSQSLFTNETVPTEVFDTVELKIVSPEPEWF
jgi:hypothetical protein